MKKIYYLFSVILLGCVCSEAAEVRFANTLDFRSMISPILAAAAPVTILKPGLNEIKIAPGIFKGKKSKDEGGTGFRAYDVKGTAGAVSYLHAFSEHFGFSVLLGYEKGTGNAPMLIEVSQNDLLGAYSGDVTQQSYVLMPSIIYDPFGGPGGFRFPIYAGFGYYKANDEREITASIGGATYQGTLEQTNTIMAPVFGLAPAFDVWKFRMNSFFIMMMGSSTEKSGSLRNVTTGANMPLSFVDDDSSEMVGTIGVGAKFTPWNLGYTFSLIKECSFHSFNWSFNWGAPK